MVAKVGLEMRSDIRIQRWSFDNGVKYLVSFKSVSISTILFTDIESQTVNFVVVLEYDRPDGYATIAKSYPPGVRFLKNVDFKSLDKIGLRDLLRAIFDVAPFNGFDLSTEFLLATWQPIVERPYDSVEVTAIDSGLRYRLLNNVMQPEDLNLPVDQEFVEFEFGGNKPE